MNNPKKKIFIVDDHPIIRRGLYYLINQEEDMVCVGEAANACEALTGIEKSKPDLIMMDLSLAGTSGLELTKQLLCRQPDLLILVMSMYDEAIYIERVLKAGAKGYLHKREVSENIVVAIRQVIGGDFYISEKWRKQLLNRYFGQPDKAEKSLYIHLSDRELEVLDLIGQGMATRLIAAKLHISVKTVESHFANIKVKLNLKNARELNQYAIKWQLGKTNPDSPV
jgi:DNA-binding NarL/FixJ family response regulator